METTGTKTERVRSVVARMAEERFANMLEGFACAYTVGLFVACIVLIATSNV